MAVVLVTAILLTWPALLLNQAPLIFSDTQHFLAMGMEQPRPLRPWGYAIFAGVPARWFGSLWPVVAMQAAMTAVLFHATLRVALPRLALTGHGGAGLGLAALTTASWIASYVMPDALTAPGILGLYLVLALPRGRGIGTALSALVIALAAASHVTHVLAALAVIGALLLWRLGAGAASPVRLGRLAICAAAVLIGAGAVIGGNAALSSHAEYTRGGSIFFGARLASQGLLQRHLDAVCPDPRLPRLCAARGGIPRDADLFLWAGNSPLREDGDFFGIEQELTIANRAILRAYWLDWTIDSVARTLQQLVTLHAGDGLDREHAVNQVSDLAMRVSPAAASRAAASRQVREELGDNLLAAIPGPLALLAFLACAVLALRRGARLARERPMAALLLAIVLLAAIANAAAVGFGGAVHARYQSRIAWLFPLAVLIVVAGGRRHDVSDGDV